MNTDNRLRFSRTLCMETAKCGHSVSLKETVASTLHPITQSKSLCERLIEEILVSKYEKPKGVRNNVRIFRKRNPELVKRTPPNNVERPSQL